MQNVWLLALGLIAGVASGMFGIGGGVVIVPILITVLDWSPVRAIGTSLAALVPPVTILAAIEHYRAGNVYLKGAVLIGLGVFIGGLLGAKILIGLPPHVVRRVYAAFLLLMGLRLLFGK
ncbi:MAG: sulfite exporter TauE/SafE family protein [Acidobacteria bacterium]|nr:sulfite exporter TauE/SafE family protein [Acidobacteriota bacterium]